MASFIILAVSRQTSVNDSTKTVLLFLCELGRRPKLMGTAKPYSTSRGMGREGISVSNPPAAIATISSRPTGRSANRRSKIQSNPLILMDAAQLGTPITGVSSRPPSNSRLPGSTGIPNCTIVPPLAVKDAGMMSRHQRCMQIV